jgi:hypothetical protein
MLDGESDTVADESHVIPAAGAPLAGSYGSYIVSATFSTRSGVTYPGAVQLDQLGNKRHLTPVLLHISGKILDPLALNVADRIARITKSPAVQLDSWRLEIALPGETQPHSDRIARTRFGQALGLAVNLIQLRFARRQK